MSPSVSDDLKPARASTPSVVAPIFIVGTGRSGTTLVSAVLSAHSRLAVTPETHFLRRALKSGPLDGGPEDFEAFWSRLRKWSRFRDLEIDAARCRASLDLAGDYSFRGIFAAMLDAFRVKLGAERVGEKTPSHRAHLPILLKWFPDARVVVMQRDPRAVVASQLKCPWVTVRPRRLGHGLFQDTRASHILHFSRDWREAYAEQIQPYLEDPRVVMLQYEALVSQPEQSVRFLCDFLHERFEQRMLGNRAEAPLARHTAAGGSYGPGWSGWVQEHHARTQAPMSTASLAKWKQELTIGEVAMIESACDGEMQRAGYEPIAQRVRRRIGSIRAVIETRCGSTERALRRTVRSGLAARLPLARRRGSGGAG